MATDADSTTRKNIYWIGGSKGGVGKSMVTMASIDCLVAHGEKALLVECDTSNPDVWKSYNEELEDSELINLDEADGWVHLVNSCDAHPDSAIVINTAARDKLSVTQYGRTLDGTLEELGRKLIVLWVINRQRDSLELLREFVEAFPHAVVHVVRNCYFGEERKFELYNGSSIRRDVEARGGQSVTFPDLADRVADDLYTKRLSVGAAARTLPIGNRAELSRWRNEVHKVLGPLLGQ